MNPKEIAFSILITICLGLTSFQLKWTFDTNAKLGILNEKVDGIIHNTATDIKQNKTLIKHWALHSWSKDEINKLRYKLNLEPVAWPPLSQYDE